MDQNQPPPQPKPAIARRVGKNDIIPGTIDQHHMSAKHAVIVFDVAANRPKVGNNYCLAFFATDTHVLSIWTNSVWKNTTLS